MAVNSFQALDKDGNAVTVYDSDDPAEAGGATLGDIQAPLSEIADALVSNGSDQIQTDVQSLPSIPAGGNNIGSVGVSSLPNNPAQTGDIQSLEDAVGDETVANAIEDPTVAGPVQDLLAGVLALLRGALSSKDADDQLRVDLQSESADLAQDQSVQDLEAYRSEPTSFDPSQNTQTPQCDAFMIPDGSNATRTIQLKATSGGSLQTITVPTNATIPMAVEETGTGGNATSFLGFNQ